MTRGKLLKSTNLHTKTHLRSAVLDLNKKYYLHMILQDRARNKSRVKTLVEYKATP